MAEPMPLWARLRHRGHPIDPNHARPQEGFGRCDRLPTQISNDIDQRRIESQAGKKIEADLLAGFRKPKTGGSCMDVLTQGLFIDYLFDEKAGGRRYFIQLHQFRSHARLSRIVDQTVPDQVFPQILRLGPGPRPPGQLRDIPRPEPRQGLPDTLIHAVRNSGALNKYCS